MSKSVIKNAAGLQNATKTYYVACFVVKPCIIRNKMLCKRFNLLKAIWKTQNLHSICTQVFTFCTKLVHLYQKLGTAKIEK